jgi:hypothetical protein
MRAVWNVRPDEHVAMTKSAAMTQSQQRLLGVACGSVLVFTMGVALIVWSGGNLSAVPAPVERRLFEWSGQDSETSTATFSAPDSWELRWEHSGEIEEIRWTNTAGASQSVYSMHRKPIRHRGSVNVSHGGDYTLQVLGTGPWRLQVFDLSPPSS